MANHVTYSVRFEQMNSAAKTKWKELTSRLVEQEHEYWFGDLWVHEDGAVSSDDVRQYDWTCENVGPKWCYIQDFDEDGFSGYSAWSAPETGLQWIIDQLIVHDPNLVTSFYYDDEMPNFYGAYVWQGNECYDGFEDDHDDLMNRVFEEYPDLKEKWNADTEEWTDDEAEDEFREVMYDVIHDTQANIVNESIEMIKEEEENNE